MISIFVFQIHFEKRKMKLNSVKLWNELVILGENSFNPKRVLLEAFCIWRKKRANSRNLFFIFHFNIEKRLAVCVHGFVKRVI